MPTMNGKASNCYELHLGPRPAATNEKGRPGEKLLHAMVAKIDFSVTNAKIRRKEPTPSLTKFSVVAI